MRPRTGSTSGDYRLSTCARGLHAVDPLSPSALREAVALLDFEHPMGIAEEASA